MLFLRQIALLVLFTAPAFAGVGAYVAATNGALYYHCLKSDDCSFCKTCPKTQYTLGIGGIYLNQSKDFDSKDSGGYVRFAFSEFLPKQRFNFTLNILLGAAQHTSNPQALFATQNPTASVFFELRPKVGVNILSQNLPLFLNLAYTFEGYNPNVGDSRYDLYKLLYHSVGGELEGLIFINPKLRLTYSAGYDYIFSGGYKTSQGKAKFDNGSTIRASVGYVYALNEKLSYYMKIQGKIQNFESAPLLTQKTQEQYIAGVELGLGF